MSAGFALTHPSSVTDITAIEAVRVEELDEAAVSYFALLHHGESAILSLNFSRLPEFRVNRSVPDGDVCYYMIGGHNFWQGRRDKPPRSTAAYRAAVFEVANFCLVTTLLHGACCKGFVRRGMRNVTGGNAVPACDSLLSIPCAQRALLLAQRRVLQAPAACFAQQYNTLASRLWGGVSPFLCCA